MSSMGLRKEQRADYGSYLFFFFWKSVMLELTLTEGLFIATAHIQFLWIKKYFYKKKKTTSSLFEVFPAACKDR